MHNALPIDMHYGPDDASLSSFRFGIKLSPLIIHCHMHYALFAAPKSPAQQLQHSISIDKPAFPWTSNSPRHLVLTALWVLLRRFMSQSSHQQLSLCLPVSQSYNH
jgi:hypothetical protein